MNDSSVFSLIAFGGWVSLLCLSLAVAGWVGDRVRYYHARKKRTAINYWAYLDTVVADDREAHGHLTADEVLHLK
jgi:hypothetical protein